jgi:3D-(3,5/4)-trihydroxycyclohexane-1,2-dione acylhydrolase (decyclizing)
LILDGGRDPAALRAALTQVGEHDDLSSIHVPVYYGPDELGGMGVYGRWNVAIWCDETQAMRHEIGM